MTIVSINLEKVLLEAFYAKVSELPPELVPLSISDDESSEQFSFSLDDLGRGIDLPIDITGGYFLHAPSAKYGVSFSGAKAKLFVEVTLDESAKAILKNVATIPIDYAYACRFEERNYQNRIISKKSYGTEEIWVGRDYNRYLPGLYWLNLIPKSLLEKHGVVEKSLGSLALFCELIGTQNYLVQLYPSSDSWQERGKEIDAWRETTRGVFYKAAAQEALDSAKTFMESSNAVSEWK